MLLPSWRGRGTCNLAGRVCRILAGHWPGQKGARKRSTHDGEWLGRVAMRLRLSARCRELGENGGMQDFANSYGFWIFVFVVLVVVYMLPTLIGIVRGVDRL